MSSVFFIADNNNDLFAKAPKPAVYPENRVDDPIGALTSGNLAS